MTKNLGAAVLIASMVSFACYWALKLKSSAKQLPILIGDDKTTKTQQSMSPEKAETLIQAWSQGGGRILSDSGRFLVSVRGVFFRYDSDAKQLLASGLVGQDMVHFNSSNKPWQRLQAAAVREEATLGEGHFELVQEKLFHVDPPILLLTKAFDDGAMSDEQFIIEVGWLREWATHWRMQRMRELSSGASQQVIEQQGKDYVEAAQKKRPRPW